MEVTRTRSMKRSLSGAGTTTSARLPCTPPPCSQYTPNTPASGKGQRPPKGRPAITAPTLARTRAGCSASTSRPPNCASTEICHSRASYGTSGSSRSRAGPTMVVPQGWSPDMVMHGIRPVIVVGTDGSPGSLEALRWALRQAQATGAEVRVLLAWEVATSLGNLSEMDDVDWADIARTAVEEAAAAEPDFSVPISTEVVNGHPSNVLVEASKDADLLVVGCRGHGRVLEMMLGSVSDHCTHHAYCPVVVVRSPATEGSPDHRLSLLSGRWTVDKIRPLYAAKGAHV